MFDSGSSGPAPEAAGEPAGPVPAGLAAAVAATDVAGARLDRVVALPPGPLAGRSARRDRPRRLGPRRRVELLQAWERASRWITARQLAAVVAVAGAVQTNKDDFAREDVRAALRDVGGSWRQDVDLARALHGPLARAEAALSEGALSYPQARALQQETEPLDDAAARAVCKQVLGDARTRTPADFRRRVRAAVIAVDPIGAELRAEAATAHRQVTRRVLPDGQAGLDCAGPALAVAAIWAVLTRRTGLTHPDDPRTLDQRRFDALLDICRTATTDQTLTQLANPRTGPTDSPDPAGPGAGDPAAPSPETPVAGRRPRRRASRTGTGAGVFVFADAATWAGLAEHPADLDGYGPIPPGMARDCFTDAQWRAVVTDALTGLVTAVSDQTYTPSPRTRRHLFAQDRGCLFPGCPAPVWYCDADHSTPHDQGGCTDPDNCGLLCRRHHRLKTHTGWTWTRHPDGTPAWTSPDGHIWTRPPQRYHYARPPTRAATATRTRTGTATSDTGTGTGTATGTGPGNDTGPPGSTGTDPHAGPSPSGAGPGREAADTAAARTTPTTNPADEIPPF